jgi:hypothetical protein
VVRQRQPNVTVIYELAGRHLLCLQHHHRRIQAPQLLLLHVACGNDLALVDAEHCLVPVFDAVRVVSLQGQADTVTGVW